MDRPASSEGRPILPGPRENAHWKGSEGWGKNFIPLAALGAESWCAAAEGIRTNRLQQMRLHPIDPGGYRKPRASQAIQPKIRALAPAITARAIETMVSTPPIMARFFTLIMNCSSIAGSRRR